MTRTVSSTCRCVLTSSPVVGSVENDQRRTAGKSHGEGDPLLLPPR